MVIILEHLNSLLKDPCFFQVKIQFAASVSIDSLKRFLEGQQNGKTAQDAVQGLDIVMRQIPSNRFTPVDRSFFPLDGYGSKYLGEGCEVQFGFYQTVRPSEWKAMLVNIDGKIQYLIRLISNKVIMINSIKKNVEFNFLPFNIFGKTQKTLKTKYLTFLELILIILIENIQK